MADINDLKTAPMKEPMKIVDPNVVASRKKPIKATLGDISETPQKEEQKPANKVADAVDLITANTEAEVLKDGTRVIDPKNIPNIKDPNEESPVVMEDQVKSKLHDVITQKQKEAKEEIEQMIAQSEINEKLAEQNHITFDEDGNAIGEDGGEATVSEDDELEAALDMELANMSAGRLNPPHEDNHTYEQVDDEEFDKMMNDFDKEHGIEECDIPHDTEVNNEEDAAVDPADEEYPQDDEYAEEDGADDAYADEDDSYEDAADDAAEEEETVTVKNNVTPIRPVSSNTESEEDIADSLLKELDEEIAEDEEDLEDEETKKELEEFTKNASKAMKLAPSQIDISGFKVDGQISASSVLSSLVSGQAMDSSDWALSTSGMPITMKKFTGIELKDLSNYSSSRRNRQNTIMERYKLIYDHDMNPYKPDTVEEWAKTISSEDEDDLFFAVYDATFHNANHIPYTCTDEKCGHAWISEHIPTSNMYRFKDPEFEAEFMAIRDKGPTKEQTRKVFSKIVPVTEKIAVGVKDPDIYDRRFVYGLVGEEFYAKYRDTLDIFPFIENFYSIDIENQKLSKIATTPRSKAGDLTRNIKNRVIIYNRIISTLDTDQYNTLIAILGQRDENEEKRHVEYIIPAATCPKCGKLIPERVLSQDSGNGTIETQLFTRRPLALMASTSTT